jgi:hypothetical protein
MENASKKFKRQAAKAARKDAKAEAPEEKEKKRSSRGKDLADPSARNSNIKIPQRTGAVLDGG